MMEVKDFIEEKGIPEPQWELVYDNMTNLNYKNVLKLN